MFLRNGRLSALLAAGVLSVAAAGAQPVPPETPDWVESEVPPPPAFDLGKLIDIDVDANVGLRYGVDPATLQIGSDGVVRYVMVAQSKSGVMTAMYEGLRCGTGDYKLYARHNAGQWTSVAQPEWKSLWESARVKHPLAFARQGGCDSRAAPVSVREIVRRLKSPGVNRYSD